MSAQICSLSENVVELCLEITTGFIQADASPAAAACGLSVREMAIPSKPLNVSSRLAVAKFDVRFEYYSREPFAHENLPPAPGSGPHPRPGSPAETTPVSKGRGDAPLVPGY